MNAADQCAHCESNRNPHYTGDRDVAPQKVTAQPADQQQPEPDVLGVTDQDLRGGYQREGDKRPRAPDVGRN